MPAVSQQQQKIMGLALSVKRGETPRSKASAEVLKIVDSMSEKELEKYAGTAHKGLPKTVEAKIREIVREVYNEMKSVTEEKVVTKKEWNRTHKDFKGMVDGKHYMMYLDPKTGSTVYGPVTIKESVNEDIWTPQQKSAVSKLDSEFDELLAKRGIEPHSKEASNLWRTSGFQNKFKKIFNKTESVTEVKMNVKIDTTSVANLVSTAGRNNVRKVEVTLKSPKSMGEWDALQKTVNTSLWPDKLLQSVIKDMNTEKTITYDVVNDALDIVDLFKNDSKRIKTANWKN